MSENPKLFALLIDGDNVQALLVPQILDKFSEFGKPIIKRVYLNKASLTQSDWDEVINKYSLEPEYVPNNTARKNAADIALVIDVMELLYDRPDLTNFCVVSSDSDFTRLAKRIEGKNKYILGIGAENTPDSFVNACSKFVYIEELLRAQVPIEQPKNISNQEKDKPNDTGTNQTFETLFIQAYENTYKDEDGWVQLIEIKGEMNALDHEFRSSDYQYMRRFAEKVVALAKSYPIGVIEIDEKLDSKPVIHCIRIDCDTFKFIEVYKQASSRERDGWVLLSVIGVELKKHQAYENGFSYRGIRSKRLSKVVMEMSQDYPKTIEIKEKDDGKSVIHLVRIKE